MSPHTALVMGMTAFFAVMAIWYAINIFANSYPRKFERSIEHDLLAMIVCVAVFVLGIFLK